MKHTYFNMKYTETGYELEGSNHYGDYTKENVYERELEFLLERAEMHQKYLDQCNKQLTELLEFKIKNWSKK